MPKIKTKKSAAKRFHYSASGKIKRQKAGKRHFLSKKSVSRKRRLSRKGLVDATDESRIKKLIPYG
jgi:large subunit ribosomal protein L35